MEGEDTDEISIADLNGQNRARGLLVVFWNGIEDPLGYGKQEALDRWCKDGLQKGGGERIFSFWPDSDSEMGPSRVQSSADSLACSQMASMHFCNHSDPTETTFIP